MGASDYAKQYRNIDFRRYPEQYVIGRGEQGVLIAEPYKSEILPFWKFATPQDAKASAQKIFELFEAYKEQGDFVGMDMARKFLQMGFTRSRRYANHASGQKYSVDKSLKPQVAGSEESPKAESARIFYKYYAQAKEDATYVKLKAEHQAASKHS